MPLVIAVDDPRAEDVRDLLRAHLRFARSVTPAEDVYALDLEGLTAPDVTFFTARQDGELLGIGALKHIDPSHAELKSMHTAEAARRRGVARALVEHLLGVAADRGYERVSLETGAMAAFAPAHRLYETIGFVPCEAFGEYVGSASSVCMTLELDGRTNVPP